MELPLWIAGVGMRTDVEPSRRRGPALPARRGDDRRRRRRSRGRRRRPDARARGTSSSPPGAGGRPHEDQGRRPGGVRRAALDSGARAGRAEGRARCSSGSSPAASATPTSTRPRAPIPPATRRPCSDTRAPASSSASARASPRSREGDHVVTLFSPQCRECVHCASAADQPLPRDSRAAEPGLPAGRDDAALAGRRADPPLHGHLDLRRVHGDARDRAREGESGGAARGRGALRVRALDRSRSGAEHGEGEARLDLRRLRRGPGRPRRRDRLPPGGRRADRLRRPLRGAARARDRRTARPRRWSAAPDAVERIVESTGGFGADYTFEATGNVGVMRQAVESARMGWGLCTVAGRGRQGRDARRRPALPDHRPPDRRLVVRRRQGARPGAAARRALARAARSTSSRSSRTGSRSTRSTAASS